MNNSVIPKPKHGAEQREAAGNAILAGEDYIQNLVQVSPKLITVRYLENLVWWIIWIALALAVHILVAVFNAPWGLHFLTLLIWLFVISSILLLPRRIKAIGYVVREDDVVYRSGLLNRRLNIVPFGRVQDIHISEGFWERKFGLSTIALSTAGDLGISIPGLSKQESDQIRDLVAREAEQKMAAL